MINYRPSAKFDKDATLILCDQSQAKSRKFSFKETGLLREILSLIKGKYFSGDNNQTFPLTFNNKLVLLVGLGKKSESSLTNLRAVVRKALLSTYLKDAKTIEIIPHDSKDSAVKAIIDGILLGTYSWGKYRAADKKKTTKQFFIAAAKKKVYEEAETICAGTNLTRDLINENADTATSDFIEKKIRALIKGKKNISIEVLSSKEMKAKGLGLHLAVNQGSQNEPKLVIVKYSGASNKGNYTALIGKGMTFDTGGLNLKPTGSIETMRMDMSGAAAVIGTLKNTIDLKLKKNIVFAVGLAENVTGSRSYKPGDVICGYAGKTVEVANTDAEGRLVLADAISYVVKNYKPGRIIDIATLTGACIVALGYMYTGLVAPDDKFARQLVRSSNESDDRVWRLPSYPELKDSVKSNIADIRNLGYGKGAGGAITAAEFLRQFTEKTTWAHLDIAGPAFVEEQERLYLGYGASGAGVRLLTHYLQNY